MNEEYTKELLDKADKSAFIIGMVYGALACIVSNINNNDLSRMEIFDAIKDLKQGLSKNIEDLYYSSSKKKILNNV